MTSGYPPAAYSGRHSFGLYRPFQAPLLLGATTKDEVIDELHRGVVHLDVERFNLVGEIVVGPHGGHGDDQAKRSGDQRFSDTAGDRRQTSRVALLDAFKRVQNADHRTEQSDERSRRADRGESREAALHFRVNDSYRALEATLGSFDDVGIGDLLGSGLEFAETRRDNFRDVALLVALCDSDGFVELAIFQRARNLLNKDARLLARGAVHQRAINHHAERINGKYE